MNKTIPSSLAVIGAAIRAAQCRTCFYYPGMNGDVLANTIADQVAPSMNERTAFELGYGACLGGERTTVVFKGIGLSTCLDSVQHAVIGGVNGGLVLILLEDTVAASSPEIIDSRTLFDYAAPLVIEPASIESASAHAQEAFTLSETLDVPIIIRLTYDLLSSSYSAPSAARRTTTKVAISKDTTQFRDKFIGSWAKRHHAYEQKQRAIQDYIAARYPAVPSATDQLAFGYAPNAPKGFPIEHYPIAPAVRNYYQTTHPTVYEQGSNYAERALQAAQPLQIDNRRVSQNTLLPSSAWEHALKTIRKEAYALIVGDEGRFTFDTTEKIDLCLCMGSAIAIAAGLSLATGKRTMAVVGDFAYQFSGYQSLVEATKRGADIDILLLDDGIAASTGGQIAIAQVTPDDVRPYLTSYTELEYGQLPTNSFIDTRLPGLNMYHIKKS